MYPLNPFQIPQTPYLSALQVPQAPQTENIQYVSGKQGVESYQMAANSSAVFLDSSTNRFYTKHTDANGTATIKSFDYTESEEDKPIEYVTKAEFETFKAHLKGAGKNESNGDVRKQQNSNVGNRRNDEG